MIEVIRRWHCDGCGAVEESPEPPTWSYISVRQKLVAGDLPPGMERGYHVCSPNCAADVARMGARR